MDPQMWEWSRSEIEERVQAHGYTVVGTLDDAGRWLLYTVGLHVRDLPELVLRGLPPDIGNPIIQDLAQRAVGGTDDLACGLREGLIVGYSMYLVPSASSRWDFVLGAVEAMYGPDVAVMQLVWPDHDCAWPWDADYSARSQPAMEERPF